eukprot:6055110-Lingulodinium_polyedra.AAC.1
MQIARSRTPREQLFAWSACACDSRAGVALVARFDHSLHGVLRTLRNDAVESAVRGHSGSQIAR